MSPKTIILASNLTSYKRSLLTLGGVNRLFGDKLMKYNTIRKNYVGGFSTKGAKDLLHLYDTVSNLSDDKRNFVQKREALYYLPFVSNRKTTAYFSEARAARATVRRAIGTRKGEQLT